MCQTTAKPIRVAVLFGGVSSEHEVSLMSAVSVLQNLPPQHCQVLMVGITRDGRWLHYTGKVEEIPSQLWESDPSLHPILLSPDRSHRGFLLQREDGWQLEQVDICFPVLHGKNGEDGTIQGLLQLAGMPFVGCGCRSSADCMDKQVSHTLLEAAGIPMARWLCAFPQDLEDKAFDAFAQRAEAELGYPMFVKPANAGSSVGVSKAHNREELYDACRLAFREDGKAIVEEFVDGLEVETAVLGNRDPQAAPVCGELVPASEFYTYEAKYIDGTTALHIPARIPEETSALLRTTAQRAFAALGCQGFARVDFFVRKSDGQIILNEINTIPGFTPISMYPKLWEVSGLGYSQLLLRLIQLGLEREQDRQAPAHQEETIHG